MGTVRARIDRCSSCGAVPQIGGDPVFDEATQMWVLTDIGLASCTAVLHYRSCAEVPPDHLLSPSTADRVSGATREREQE